MPFITRFANPRQFVNLADSMMPWIGCAALLTYVIGIYFALFNSPPDYQQGETVRIMYVHVPAAWMGTMIYSAMALASAVGLVTRHTLADIFCVAAAPVGAVFVGICLITGSLWGRPTWGAWWVWDARLTSVLILFLLYCGLIVLRKSFDDHERGFRATAILSLIGAVNIPIIKFSVEWWNTLHQPASVLRMSGPTIDPHMLRPLLIMAVVASFFGVYIVLMRMKTELLKRRAEAHVLLDP
jgi:heme exporter protein C